VKRGYHAKTRFGKSGLEVSALGMGWAIGGPWTWAQPGGDPYPAGWGNIDDRESVRAIHAGLESGVNFFDTAANYGAGHSEVVLGQALKSRRDQVVIATKFGHSVNEQAKTVYGDPDQVLKNVRSDVENSLRRLQTDLIDIYQLHDEGMTSTWRWSCAASWRPVAQGKIRWYGWNDLVDCVVFAGGEHCTPFSSA
jgi:aryl-alcohol dehydrogenase-like predicted oxidoreductase